MRYRNFDLCIWELAGDRYRLHAEGEGHGQAKEEVQIDAREPGLRAQLRRLAERDTDRTVLEALGTALFDRLFVGDVRRCFDRSYGDVAEDPSLGLRLRLRIEPAELAALPWELFFDRGFIATRVVSPVLRYVEAPRVERELRTRLPLRLLVVIPQRSRELPGADREKEIIAQALADLEREVEVTYLHDLHADGCVTWTRICECLAEREGGYHCLHFIGHGGFRAGRGSLLLDPEDGSDGVVPDEDFARLFTNHRAMKLVVLNACESATLSSSQPLAGCAARLVEQGVPAVVAMQYGIRDAAAVDFARSFYRSLFRSPERGRVDTAITQGRNVLAAKHAGQRELATPVLFMHTDNGVLFAPETGSPWRDLPFSTRARHTVEAAQEETGSASEVEHFRRWLRIAKLSVRSAFAAALLGFALLWVGALDYFALETGAEFVTMALGESVVASAFSDDLRVVTIDAGDLAGAEAGARIRGLRQREAAVVRQLAASGARAIALDTHFAVGGDGGFDSEPEAGRDLVAAIRDVRPTTAVVVGAKSLAGGELAVPKPLREAAGVGHLCPETKLGLARALPISVAKGDRRLPSLALAAYAAYRGGTILERVRETDGSEDDHAVVLLPEAPSVRFAASELDVPERDPGDCRVIEAGDRVALRFLRLTPLEVLREHTMTAEELAAPGGIGDAVRGKVVLVGILGVGDVVEDLAGTRPGVYWHAAALDNLLRDEEIRPLSDGLQLPIMLALAGAAAALRLRFRLRRALGRALAGVVVVLFVASVVYSYAAINLLINPAYHLVAFGVAWWWAGRAGERWLH
jgi:CHASE2 domain-containing sensor protein